jgi:UPF0755 protein
VADKRNIKKHIYNGFDKKPRANTGCLRGIMYFLFIVTVSVFLAVFGWNCINDVLALTKADKPVEITIPENFDIRDISKDLADLGVISHPWLFNLFSDYSGAAEKIEPGHYTINANYDYNAIVKSFVNRPVREAVKVVVPEGRNLVETLTLIAEAGVSDLESLLLAADAEEFAFGFLEDLPMTPGRLEGYLFPDTYDFYTTARPRAVLLRLLNTFNRNFNRGMRKSLDEMDYTLNEILTIASLIQLEAANETEMRDISSVIHNRLNSNTMRRLQIDATSVYLIGIENVGSAEDVLRGRQIDSPYNTFLYDGLPPGPICSPGITAIRAALWPSKTNYYFYALHVDRTHRFFTNRDAFDRFLRSGDFANF